MLRHELDGLRFRLEWMPGRPTYLVYEGQFRHVLNEEVYRGLFEDNDGIYVLDSDMGYDFEIGEPITTSVGMARYIMGGGQSDAQYLEIRHPPRPIKDMQTMLRYNLKRNSMALSSDPTKGTLGPELAWEPRYNGNFVRAPDGTFYFIDEGKRRRIPNGAVGGDLFGATAALDNPHIEEQVPLGRELDATNRLVSKQGKIWFLDGGRRRHIVDPRTMRYYGFANGTVFTQHSDIPTASVVRSPCGRNATLFIRTTIDLTSSNSSASGAITDDDATFAFTHQLHLGWDSGARCAS